MPHSTPTGHRVLIVDDNHDAADMLAEALTMYGLRARIASDGPSAIDLAREFRPEVALLDIGLPIMDGYELAGRLRALPGMSEVRLVAITGYGQDADRARSQQAGFDEHLVKPVEIQAVVPVLDRLLAQRA
jgi:CheY-like chemotaxis protein